MTKEAMVIPIAIANSQARSVTKSQWFKKTVLLLVMREWRRLLLEPSRVLGVLIQPLLFLVVFGVGFHKSFYVKDTDLNYASFFFPGILGLVILFSSIYATLTLVDDKRCGFFRLVMVGPSGVFGAVMGKVLATASLSIVQGLLFLPICFFLPITKSVDGIMWAVGFLVIGSITFSVIGVLFAWLCPSASAFHALMSVVLIPMWLLSGAMFPLDFGLLYFLSYLNPMAYLVAGLRDCLLNQDLKQTFNFLGLFFCCGLGFLLLIPAIKKRPLE